MNEKFNKNANVEKFTNMLGIAVRLIVIDPYTNMYGKFIVKFHSLYMSIFKMQITEMLWHNYTYIQKRSFNLITVKNAYKGKNFEHKI